jgi:Transposase IS4
MAKILRENLTESEISDLINGDNSDLESDGEDNDENSRFSDDDDDLPIEHTVAPGLAPSTMTLHRENLSGAEQSRFSSTAKMDIKWRRKAFTSSRIAFTDTSSSSNGPVGTPISYFEKYFTKDIIKKFSENTNIYALQNDSIIKETNPSEIRQLIGLHMYMGCNKLPRLRLYWSPLMGLGKFNHSSIMTQKRFCQLRNNLHLVNNLERPSDCKDKFFKVRPLLDTIRNRCRELAVEECVAVDEQMIPFKGRHSCKQYIPSKPCPWAFKNFVICGRSGQPYDFIMYQGSSTELHRENLAKYGHGASVVLHLSQRLTKPGHQIYMDNFFTTYQVLELLKAKEINAAGTIRVNRFNKPPILSDQVMKKKRRGFSDEVTSLDEKIVLVKWLDNRMVNIASNFVGIGKEDTVAR